MKAARQIKSEYIDVSHLNSKLSEAVSFNFVRADLLFF